MHLPANMEPRMLLGQNLQWVRVRVVQARSGQGEYSSSPVIRSAEFLTLGGSAWASHSAIVSGELLGRASGAPGETFGFSRRPILPRRHGEYVEVLEGAEGNWTAWTEVESFQESGPDPFVHLDCRTDH